VGDDQTAERAVALCLKQLQARLAGALKIANAAAACLDAGGTFQAVNVSMDIEPLLYEANQLYEAALILRKDAQE
jgi:hypothetical protein